MILNIDLGNTRLKYQFENGEKIAEVESFANNFTKEVLENWQSKPISKVRLASVGATLSHNLIIDWCKKNNIHLNLFETGKNFAEIQNAYGENYQKLGIDRWLNIIAAYRGFGAVFVVSAGSALTLDKINSLGQHLGGFIVPGFQLSLDALKGKANFLQKINFEPAKDFYGTSTNKCVSLGIVKMFQGLLHQAYQEENLKFIITGGDAKLLAKNLNLPHFIVDDLIFKGMRVYDKEANLNF